MDQDVVSFAGVMLTIISSVAGLALIYVACRFALASAKAKERGPARLDDGKLEQLQQSVDSIAIEVERISEGQRFTTKLLSEQARVAPRQLQRQASGNTPI